MNSQSNVMLGSATESQAFTTSSISSLQRFYWSLRRELWEHRAIYLAPLGAAILFLIGFVIAAPHLPAQTRAALALGLPHLRHHIEEPYDLAAALIMGVALLLSLFYSLDCLQSERRDRSILFWKSLPVSDLTTVLAKACIPLFVIPLVAFAITAATQFIMVLISAAILAVTGFDVAALWAQHSLLRSWWLLLYHLIMVHGLWWAPFYGWLLLVSAWARRGSFLWTVSWAVVPPFAIGYFEYLVFHTSHFAHLLQNRFSGAGMDSIAAPGTMPMNPMTQLTPVRFLTSAGLWIGLAIFAAFITGAVRLRRQRGPV
jgi:ABC-2 type transport system permease protein